MREKGASINPPKLRDIEIVTQNTEEWVPIREDTSSILAILNGEAP